MSLTRLIEQIPETADFHLNIERKGKRYFCSFQLFFGQQSFTADASSANLDAAISLLVDRLNLQLPKLRKTIK